MGVTYAQVTDAALLEPAELSERLAAVMRDAMKWFEEISDKEASRPEREGKWSAKQVVGHLTDSAVNNLGRIVRMQITPGLAMQGYEQMEWVTLQHYQARTWTEVLEVWCSLNRHIGWVIARVEKTKLANTGVVEGDAMTLGYLIEDYIAHMEHHLRLMRGWL